MKRLLPGSPAVGTSFYSGHVLSPLIDLADRARATRTVRTKGSPLIGEHSLQSGLIGRIGHHALVQFLLAFVRLGGQDVAAEGVVANNLARAGFLEPLR